MVKFVFNPLEDSALVGVRISAEGGPVDPRDQPLSPLPDRLSPGAGRSDWPTRVLIVEDNADAADTLRALLQTAGYDVATAHNGESALNAACTFEPDVILCDIDLPGEANGYDVARCLRTRGNKAFMVAVTGFGRPQDVRQAHEAGFDVHLTKPMRLAQLENLLSQPRHVRHDVSR